MQQHFQNVYSNPHIRRIVIRPQKSNKEDMPRQDTFIRRTTNLGGSVRRHEGLRSQKAIAFIRYKRSLIDTRPNKTYSKPRVFPYKNLNFLENNKFGREIQTGITLSKIGDLDWTK